MNNFLYFFREFSLTFIPILTAITSIVFLFRSKSFKSNLLKTEEGDISPQLNYESDVALSSNEKQLIILKQYHSQGLAQSRISFWFSLIFAGIGFAIIIISILSSNNDKSFWTQNSSIISLISGVIIDSVSALFFVQSNKSRELMSNFFDKLRVDRKIEESLKLADEIPDEYLRSKLKLILSLHFAEIVPSDNIISLVLRELDDRGGKSSTP